MEGTKDWDYGCFYFLHIVDAFSFNNGMYSKMIKYNIITLWEFDVSYSTSNICFFFISFYVFKNSCFECFICLYHLCITYIIY